MHLEAVLATVARRHSRYRRESLLVIAVFLVGCAGAPRVQPGRLPGDSPTPSEPVAVSPEDERWAEFHRRAAEAGDPRSSALMGLLYQIGRGVPRDDEESARWFRVAAELDECAGQYHLGLLHLQGKAVPKSIDLATYWFRRAEAHGGAEQRRSFRFLYQGIPIAMRSTRPGVEMGARYEAEVAHVSYLRGLAYVEGTGVPFDPGLAMRFFDFAADQRHTDAQYAIGRGYLEGVGMARDRIRAAQWLAIAAGSGHEEARRELERLKATLTPDEIAKAESLALQWRDDRRRIEEIHRAEAASVRFDDRGE